MRLLGSFFFWPWYWLWIILINSILIHQLCCNMNQYLTNGSGRCRRSVSAGIEVLNPICGERKLLLLLQNYLFLPKLPLPVSVKSYKEQELHFQTWKPFYFYHNHLFYCNPIFSWGTSFLKVQLYLVFPSWEQLGKVPLSIDEAVQDGLPSWIWVLFLNINLNRISCS